MVFLFSEGEDSFRNSITSSPDNLSLSSIPSSLNSTFYECHLSSIYLPVIHPTQYMIYDLDLLLFHFAKNIKSLTSKTHLSANKICNKIKQLCWKLMSVILHFVTQAIHTHRHPTFFPHTYRAS